MIGCFRLAQVKGKGLGLLILESLIFAQSNDEGCIVILKPQENANH